MLPIELHRMQRGVGIEAHWLLLLTSCASEHTPNCIHLLSEHTPNCIHFLFQSCFTQTLHTTIQTPHPVICPVVTPHLSLRLRSNPQSFFHHFIRFHLSSIYLKSCLCLSCHRHNITQSRPLIPYGLCFKQMSICDVSYRCFATLACQAGCALFH